MAAKTAPNSSKDDKLLARMRRNPRGDWRIEQLKTIAGSIPHSLPAAGKQPRHLCPARQERAGRLSPFTFASLSP
jgi:hypothetical protein